MSKTKTQGKTSQHRNRPGDRKGMKMYGGQVIKTGQIIVTQKGTVIKAGKNVGVGRDHTLYAKTDGQVNFITRLGRKYATITN